MLPEGAHFEHLQKKPRRRLSAGLLACAPLFMKDVSPDLAKRQFEGAPELGSSVPSPRLRQDDAPRVRRSN